MHPRWLDSRHELQYVKLVLVKQYLSTGFSDSMSRVRPALSSCLNTLNWFHHLHVVLLVVNISNSTSTANSNKHRLLLCHPRIKSPDCFKKCPNFVSCWVRRNFVNPVKCCLPQIINYFSPSSIWASIKIVGASSVLWIHCLSDKAWHLGTSEIEAHHILQFIYYHFLH